WGSEVVNRSLLENRNLEGDLFFCATHARRADADGPHVGNFVEVPRRTSRVRVRPFAAQLVETPAVAMAVVTEDLREASVIEMSAARALFVNQAVVGKFRAQAGI